MDGNLKMNLDSGARSDVDESLIVFTGGSGRLGRACKKIIPGANYPGRLELDVLDPAMIDKYFSERRVQTVVHMAALASIPLCESDKARAYAINVDGTKNVLSASVKHGVRHFIYMSTACVFPGTDDEAFEDEDSIPYPKHYYGLTKYIAEEICRAYDSPEMKVTVVRSNFSTMPWSYPKAFSDRYGTYLFAQGVSKGILDVIKARPERGTIHICGDRKMSMYEYALAGGSDVAPMTLDDYNGPPLTRNMCLKTKYWKTYHLEDSDFND